MGRAGDGEELESGKGRRGVCVIFRVFLDLTMVDLELKPLCQPLRCLHFNHWFSPSGAVTLVR